MIGLVVVTHGALAETLLATAELIVGPLPGAVALSLSRGEAPELLRGRLTRAIAEAGDGCEAVLLMTDMFGGTPSNIGMTLLEPGRVDLLTGVNLPMLLKFFNYRNNHHLAELAPLLKEQAREAIIAASDLLPRQG
jgi:PTS system mannose-specific IIA component